MATNTILERVKETEPAPRRSRNGLELAAMHSLIETNPPLIIPSDSTVGDAMKLLGEKGARWGAIVDENGDDVQGLVDKIDLIGCLLSEHGDLSSSKAGDTSFLDLPVTEAIGLSNNMTCTFVKPSTPLWNVIERMVQTPARVLIADSDDVIVGACDSASILRYIVDNSLLGPAEAQTTMLCERVIEPDSYTEDTIVGDVFLDLFASSAPGVVIVDGEGKYVDVLDDTDVKYLTLDTMDDLKLGVREFLTKAKKENAYTESHAILNRTDDLPTLSAVASEFAVSRITSVVVLDADGKPQRMITPEAVLSEILEGYDQFRSMTPDWTSDDERSDA